MGGFAASSDDEEDEVANAQRLSDKYPIDADIDVWTACRVGATDWLKHQIDNVGCDIAAIDEFGNYPLQLAAFCGHVAVVRLLLAHGAVEQDTRAFDNALTVEIRNILRPDGVPANVQAEQAGDDEAAAAVETGGAGEAVAQAEAAAARAATAQPEGDDDYDDEYAWDEEEQGHDNVANADAEAADEDEDDGFFMGGGFGLLSDDEDDDAKAQRNSDKYPVGADIDVWTACRVGALDWLKHKIDNVGCDVDAVDDYGNYPLQLAAFCGHIAVVRLLLAHGAVEQDTRAFDNALTVEIRDILHPDDKKATTTTGAATTKVLASAGSTGASPATGAGEARSASKLEPIDDDGSMSSVSVSVDAGPYEADLPLMPAVHISAT